MPKIVIVDTVYPDFLKEIAAPMAPSYTAELRKFLDLGFGTHDAYSHYLAPLGWDAVDIVANHAALQELWARVIGFKGTPQEIVINQIQHHMPDVIFLQDLSFFDATQLADLKKLYLLAGQCSCPMPRRENVAQMDLLFTSFPHYLERFRALGVQAEYIPLAFDPRMLEDNPRDIEISFVGGVGRRSHWDAGTSALEGVATRFWDRFRWYGYGRENLEPDSALLKCYRGTAWGRQMCRVYGRSKIVVNRHGEVAEGVANNLRIFEATGMGAFLMSELSPNLGYLNPYVHGYKDGDDLCDSLERILNNYDDYAKYAKWGQDFTLRHHTYTERMPVVSAALNEAWTRRFPPVS